jgi:hypothetical protein
MVKNRLLQSSSLLILAFLINVAYLHAQSPLKTKNVFLIVADGFRWQEVFTGADSSLLNSEHGGIWGSEENLRRDYWRENVNERRKLLLPFLWNVVAAKGQIFGNQTLGSFAHVTNGLAFSYPGYNEILTGVADPRIDSNEFGPNPNATVFEWLNNQPEFHNRVAVFGTWSNYKDIFNQSRSHLSMQVGWDLPFRDHPTPRQQVVNDFFLHTTRLDADDVYDSFLQIPLLDSLQSHHPRVLFVGYGETDNWAHSGRYDLVLESARQFDHFVEQLWNAVQSNPAYKDQTTFIITTDHGRGSGLVDWKEHGVDQKGSENIWIAVIGPDTPALGERKNIPPVTQSQIASTLAALLGKDYRHDVPKAAAPLSDVLPTPGVSPK